MPVLLTHPSTRSRRGDSPACLDLGPLDARRGKHDPLGEPIAALHLTRRIVMFSTWIFTSSSGPQ